MKKFLATVAATVAALAPTGALAQNNNIKEHQHLWDTLQRAGITMLVNDKKHCSDGDAAGMYMIYQRTLVVCQDNATHNNGRMVAWTENDLDTLRHEAHHVVQDCLKYNMGDGQLAPLFDKPGELNSFVKGILTPRQVGWIVRQYSKNGADDEVLTLEVEAFAVAAGVGPRSIADAIQNNCSVR